MPEKADWTFMVYMAADNNLSSFGEEDLAQMRQVGSSESVNIVVEIDGAGDHGTRRIHIAKGGANETIETIGETDSGDPDVLFNFISWAAEKYPAKRYALILWSHGDGWEPAEVGGVPRLAHSAVENSGGATDRSAGPLQNAFFRKPIIERAQEAPTVERAILSDDGSGHSLDTIELGNVLKKGVEVIGQPFDLIGMDACLMSNLEVIYQLREHVRYFVASEIKAPAEGWPYDLVIGRLVANPDIASADFARSIVTDYITWYVDDPWSSEDVTQAAYDVSRIGSLVESIDTLAGELILGLDENFEVEGQAIWDAQVKTLEFEENFLRDIGQFSSELIRTSKRQRIVEAATKVVEAHRVGEGQAIIEEGRSGSKVKDLHGASLYFPIETEVSPYYMDLDFAQNIRWSKMLKSYSRE